MCLVSHLHSAIYGLVRVFLNQWRMLNSAADLGVRIDRTISLSMPNNKGQLQRIHLETGVKFLIIFLAVSNAQNQELELGKFRLVLV